MLCEICVGMLREGRGDLWTGTFDLTFEHHKTTTTLRGSTEAGCSICIKLANTLQAEMDLREDRPVNIRASLRKVSVDQPGETQYRLDFDLENKYTRIFLLKEKQPLDHQPRTVRSFDTSSDEVSELAQDWMKQCTCADFWGTSEVNWYPKRLLDLHDFRNANGLTAIDGPKFLSEHGDIERTKVRLIEPNDIFEQQKRGDVNVVTMKNEEYNKGKNFPQEIKADRYVTLSHCWGRPKSLQGQLKLSGRTEERFKREGIELREMSKTFRDAILFACRLERVGFIWIDSLCIKQNVTDSTPEDAREAKNDWLEQSRVMDKIYRKSFLNISATAAIDGDQGLFSNRRPELLWENEININYTGTNLVGSTGTDSTQEDDLVRCTLIDVSFWEDLVERAPVNCRGWVLQERLMAPRVLHFCHDQIAWECKEFQAAEGHPEMNPTLSVKLGDVVDAGRLKNLSPEAGLELRQNRLKGFADPDEHMTQLHVYELWKRVVEVYSRMNLTMSSDKLIALAGTASFFFDEHFGKDSSQQYIAGMWSQNLESQLLWYVNEVFRDGVFENPALRDASRAPSFSWACIDSPHGITYADVTDYGAAEVQVRNSDPDGGTNEDNDDVQMGNVIKTRQCRAPTGLTAMQIDQNHNAGTYRINDDSVHVETSESTEELLFKVLKHRIVKIDPQNPFGMIEEGQILIQPRFLRRIELRKLGPPFRLPYSWRLFDNDSGKSVEHGNVCLDAPESDADIFGSDAELYVMPAAYGERTVRKAFRYLYCLLLKYEGEMSPLMFDDDTSGHTQSARKMGEQVKDVRKFRRIGITKLSNHLDEKAQKQLKSKKADEEICLV